VKPRSRYLRFLLGHRIGDVLMGPIVTLLIVVFALGGAYLAVKLAMSLVNAM